LLFMVHGFLDFPNNFLSLSNSSRSEIVNRELFSLG